MASPQGIGRGMIALAWLLVLGLLTLFFSQFLEQQNNPNARPATMLDDQGKQWVILERNRYGHYLANGFINGQAVLFFIDTGATNVAIPEAQAQRLGLQRGAAITVSTANGLAAAYRTRLHSVSLGSITLSDLEGSINPGMDGEEILLGMSFLRHLEFTQRGKQLMLRQ